MEKRYSRLASQEWVQVAILIGFCIVLFFFNLGRWDLWNPDEPRYAQVAREMVNGGDWILMHVNGKIYADKPPLFFWLIAFSSYLWQGFSSFSVRFSAALFGTLTVLLTFFLGKILYSSRTGFLSGLILATSYAFAYLSTRANIDTTLTFFTTASLLCFFQWYRRGQDKAKNLKKADFHCMPPRDLTNSVISVIPYEETAKSRQYLGCARKLQELKGSWITWCCTEQDSNCSNTTQELIFGICRMKFQAPNNPKSL